MHDSDTRVPPQRKPLTSQLSKLPVHFAPWTPVGFVENGAQPPHNFSRFKIEAALKLVGFQLWRAKQKVEPARIE